MSPMRRLKQVVGLGLLAYGLAMGTWAWQHQVEGIAIWVGITIAVVGAFALL